MSRRYALALLTLWFPLALDAQRADTTMVPRDLAVALIAASDYAGNLPAIVVGRVPASYLSPLVPRGSAVLGGVSYGGRRDASRSATILSMMEDPDSALVLVQAQMERAGWKLAPLPDMGGGEGFALGPEMPGRIVSYCSDSASVYASVVEGANRSSIVRLMSQPSLRNTTCDPDSHRFMMRGRREGMVQLPTLRPPPGSSGGSMGSGGSGDSRESTARLNSTLGAAEMIAHFAPQLEEQGWKLGSRASDRDVTVLTARKTDERGEQLYLMLADNRWSTRQHELSLRVWRPSAP